jgi:hypothetical protein
MSTPVLWQNAPGLFSLAGRTPGGSASIDRSGPHDISFPNVGQLFRNNSAGKYNTIISAFGQNFQNLSTASIINNATGTRQILNS